MRLVHFVDEPVYREGLDYLLDSHHPSGAWGDLETARREFGEQADEGMILHTTMVVIDALTLSFRLPWNPARGRRT